MNKKKRRTIIAAFLVAFLLIGVSVAVTIPKAKESTEKEQLKGTEQQTADENTQERETKEDTEGSKNPSTDMRSENQQNDNVNKSEGGEEINQETPTPTDNNGVHNDNPNGNDNSGASNANNGSSGNSNTKPSTPKPPEPSKPSVPETPKPAPHTHSYGAWKVVKNPTCAEEGKQERTCSCGKTESKVISKTKDHKWETRTRTEQIKELHQICNGCGYDYGSAALMSSEEYSEVLQRHIYYDDEGNERTGEDFEKHGAYHDEYVYVDKLVEYQVCTVCGMEQ